MLAILICLLVSQIVLIAIVIRTISGAKRSLCEAQDKFRSYISPGADGGPSEMAQVVDAMSQIAAARIASSVQAIVRGMMGGTTKAINSALEGEALEQNPQLSMLESLAPGMAKKLGKNPLAMMALNGVMSKLMAGGSAGTGRVQDNNNGSTGGGFANRLKKW